MKDELAKGIERRESSHSRKSTVGLLVASKKRRLLGMPKKSIALFREPTLFSSVGKAIDPYSKRPQQMVLLSTATRKEIQASSSLRSPQSPLQAVPTPVRVSSRLKSMATGGHQSTSHSPIRMRSRSPSSREQQRTPSSQREPERSRRKKDVHKSKEIKNEMNDERGKAAPRKSQLQVYHKIPRSKVHTVSTNRSPRQMAIDLAVDMITEFELIMTKIGVGPVCVPEEKEGCKSQARNTLQKVSPMMDRDDSDYETDCESGIVSKRHTRGSTTTINRSLGTRDHRNPSFLDRRQPSHLSYLTILSGEVEVEMEESFDDNFDYRDDSTFLEYDETSGSNDEDDDDDSGFLSSNLKVLTPSNWETFDSIPKLGLDENPFWLERFPSDFFRDSSFVSRRTQGTSASESDANRWAITDKKGRSGIKEEDSLSTMFNYCTIMPFCQEQTNLDETASSSILSDVPIDHSSIQIPEKEKSWLIVITDHLLTRFSFLPNNNEEAVANHFPCFACGYQNNEAALYRLPHGDDNSSMFAHSYVDSEIREPYQVFSEDSLFDLTHHKESRPQGSEERASADSTACNNVDLKPEKLKKKESRAGSILRPKSTDASDKLSNNKVKGRSPIGAADTTNTTKFTITTNGLKKKRVPEWGKLLASLSSDSEDEPSRRQVTFSPSVLSNPGDKALVSVESKQSTCRIQGKVLGLHVCLPHRGRRQNPTKKTE